MIQANELRIGNYVLPDNDINQEHTINKEDFIQDSLNSLYPVPLTEDWLLRFGFGINLPKTAYWDKEEFLIGIMNEKLYFGYWEHDEDNEPYVYPISLTPLEYVHQLQNLYFAITGSELVLSNVPASNPS